MQEISSNRGLQLIIDLILVLLFYVAIKILSWAFGVLLTYCCPKTSTVQSRAKKDTDSQQDQPQGYRSTFGSHTCTHGPYGSPKVLTILNRSVGVGASPFCEDCTVEYFNKYSTKCAKCGDVICPGMPCAQVYSVNVDAKYENSKQELLTVCLKSTCNTNPGLYQQWGEGKINYARFGKQ